MAVPRAALATFGLVALVACLAMVSRPSLSHGPPTKNQAHHPSADPFHHFNTWLEAHERNAGDVDTVDGARRAEKRAEHLKLLVKHNPQRALELAIPAHKQAELSEDVSAHMERWVSGKATIEVYCPIFLAEDLDEQLIKDRNETLGNDEELYHVVHFEDESFATFTFGRRSRRPYTSHVNVFGIVVDGVLAMHESPLRELSAEEATQVHAKHLAVRAGDSPSVECPVTGKVASPEVGAEIGGEVLFFHSEEARRSYQLELEDHEDTRISERANHLSTLDRPLETIVFIVKFSDEENYPTDAATYQQVMATTISFWDLNSYGMSSFNVKYVNVALSGSRSSFGACPILSKSSSLDDQTWIQSGEVEDSYDRYLIVFAKFDGCAWAGLGSIANTGTWVNGRYDPVAHWHVTAHELGHNYGLKHANLWGGQPTGSGPTVAYGDDFDVMGAVHITHDNRFSFHVNAEKKNILDWIPDSDIVDITENGVYRVYAHDKKTATGVRAARIFKESSKYYWVEYRVSIDYGPARNYFLNGASIRFGYDVGGFGKETDLLDMTAPFVTGEGYDDNIDNCPLQLGRTYADGDFWITPTVISGGAREYLEIAVIFNDGSPNAAPIKNAEPGVFTVACSSPEVNEEIVLTADVSDSDLDDLAFDWDFGDGTPSTVSAGTVSHAWTSTGSFAVSVRVSDMRGGLVTATLASPIVVQSAGGSTCPPCANNCFDRGSCVGGICRCTSGYTGADCGTDLTVSDIRFNFGNLAGGDTVTVTGTGFGGSATASQVACNFATIGATTTTHISSTEVHCLTPTHTVNESIALEVSVSSDISASGLVYTYGGGECPSNCSGTGDCNVGPGVCTCFPGYSDRDCSVPIGLTGPPLPASGPLSGGSVVVVPTNFLSASSPTCQFGNFAPVLGTFDAPSGEVSCVTPVFGAQGVVNLRASPDGRSYTLPSEQFTFTGIIGLVDAQTFSGTSASVNDLKYFRFDCTVAAQLLLTVTSGTAYYSKDTVPDLSASSTTTSATISGTAGVYYVVVEAPGAFTVSMSYVADRVLTVDDPAITSFASAGVIRYFSVPFRNNGRGLTIYAESVSGTNPTVLLGNTGQPVTAANNLASGPFVSLQSCDTQQTYRVGVIGNGRIFELRARSIPVPQPQALPDDGANGLLTTITRGVDYVSLELPFSVDAETYDFDLVYEVYYRVANPGAPFENVCQVKADAAVVKFEQPVELKAMTNPEIRVSGLQSSTIYDMTVVVTNTYGVSNVYTHAPQRTKPPAIPKNLIYAVFAGCVVIATCAGCLIFVVKIRGSKPKKKRHRRHKRKKRKAGEGGGPRRGPRQGGPRAAGVRQGRAGPSTGGTAGAGAGPRGPRAGASTGPSTAASTAAVGGARASGQRPRGGARQGGGRQGGAASGKSTGAAAAAAPQKGAVASQPAKARIVGIALSDFHAQYDNELPFKKGDYINLIKDLQNGWLRGELNGKVGLVPANYVRKVKATSVEKKPEAKA